MSKHALIVFGGWTGHTPKESADVFLPLLQAKGYEVTLSETLDSYLDADLMGRMDLIIQVWTMGKITNEQWAGLEKAVRGGAGFAGFHGGIIDSFRENTGYQFMTGGQWVAHPGNSDVVYQVNLVDRQHPITRGLSDFTLDKTEQYYMHVDPGVHVLAATTFTGQYGEADQYAAGTVMPYAWTRQWGKGKVFVAAWGHTFKDFDVAPAREIVLRGMVWATR
ncbi:MAG: ThuA domain-containing protein [Phycisphaeraceae bacterium]|nr:ThuA domain-containing protein [Phycisphaeraceae bacterium]